MKLSITYKDNGGFSVEAGTEEELIYLYNLAQRTLWGRNARAMTLEDMDEWLGWK